MKKILILSAIVASAAASAPVFAQDQGDPNPPALQEVEPHGKPAVAQESEPAPPSSTPSEPGDTSGPAAGKPVTPPTVVQKDNPHIPDITPPGVPGPSAVSAGAPGIEGKKGTQAGQEWLPPEELRRKRPGS